VFGVYVTPFRDVGENDGAGPPDLLKRPKQLSACKSRAPLVQHLTNVVTQLDRRAPIDRGDDRGEAETARRSERQFGNADRIDRNRAHRRFNRTQQR